jgi:hypothetical protein
MKAISLIFILFAIASCDRRPDLSGVYTYSTDRILYSYDLQSSGAAKAKMVLDVFEVSTTDYEGSWDFAAGIVTVKVRKDGDKDFAEDVIGKFTVEPNGDLLTVESPEFKKSGVRFVKQRAP